MSGVFQGRAKGQHHHERDRVQHGADHDDLEDVDLHRLDLPRSHAVRTARTVHDTVRRRFLIVLIMGSAHGDQGMEPWVRPYTRPPDRPADVREHATMTTSTKLETPARPSGNAVDRFFRLSERGTSVSREIRGGVATFFALAYIVVLNPIILGSGKDLYGHTLNLGQLTAATALVAGVMTLIMGVGGNLPLAIAA